MGLFPGNKLPFLFDECYTWLLAESFNSYWSNDWVLFVIVSQLKKWDCEDDLKLFNNDVLKFRLSLLPWLWFVKWFISWFGKEMNAFMVEEKIWAAAQIW